MRVIHVIAAAIGFLMIAGIAGGVDQEVHSAFNEIPFTPTPARTVLIGGLVGVVLLYWGARPFFIKKNP